MCGNGVGGGFCDGLGEFLAVYRGFAQMHLQTKPKLVHCLEKLFLT
jgi:hypothetical protein